MSASNESSAGATTRPVTLHRLSAAGDSQELHDHVAVEEPLEIRVKGHAVAVTMRTPGHDAELAAGFLFTEGLIRAAEDLRLLAHCQQAEIPHRENILNVYLSPAAAETFRPPSARGPVNVSCGLCGKTSIEAVHQHFPALETTVTVSPRVLAQLPAQLSKAQPAFARTGGLHAAALFTIEGGLRAVREDIGRHNAVDKLIGHALLNGWLPLHDHILLVSGRTSFEILQKALAARLPVVAGISAPSSLAVNFARESHQTLIGFLRGETMNLYTDSSEL
jgi:FdhD protein